MMGYQYSFEKLEVWKEARLFVSDIYQIVKCFPADEKFVLTQQICRAAISVVSNITEGVSRLSFVEKVRFINISYSSLMEVYCQLCIASDLKYITDEELVSLKTSINKISYKLTALSKAYKQQTSQPS
jgi:four helix bundle protein